MKFTSALKRFFPTLAEEKVNAGSVREALEQIEIKYPGITQYLTNESGALRKHVNIFVRGELIQDRDGLLDAVRPDDESLIFQALSGG